MLKLSAEEIQALDRLAIERVGIPSIVLMENAGRRAADEILQKLKRSHKCKVCIFCGSGNNAGDGFVVGRYLLQNGFRPDIFLIGEVERLKQDARINFNILERLRYPVIPIDHRNYLNKLKKTDIVIDAIFGVGLNRPVEEPFKNIIEQINGARKYVFAIDIPSGLDATTGKIHGSCIKAAETITFSCPKKGLFVNDGPVAVGKIKVVDTGIPKSLIKEIKYGR